MVSSLVERLPMLGECHNEGQDLADALADDAVIKLVEAGGRKGSKPFQILLAYIGVLLEKRVYNLETHRKCVKVVGGQGRYPPWSQRPHAEEFMEVKIKKILFGTGLSKEPEARVLNFGG